MISPCLCSTQAVRLRRAQWSGYSKKCRSYVFFTSESGPLSLIFHGHMSDFSHGYSYLMSVFVPLISSNT